MSDGMPITNPWVIVHQPGGMGAPMETILGGPPDVSVTHMGLAIADIVRHVARAFDCDEADVLAVMEAELDSPTTSIERTGPN